MTYKKKLIEVALPLVALSAECARERSIRHGHPSTLHKWWARRPLAAARAILFASLVDDPSATPDRFRTVEEQDAERARLFAILEQLVAWESSNSDGILSAARAEIAASLGDAVPLVVDPFCGGGTIPLEAQRLGLPAAGGDLNPVATLISKAMVEIPSAFVDRPPVNPHDRSGSLLDSAWRRSEGLASDVRYYGQLLMDRAAGQLSSRYQAVEVPPQQGGGTAVPVGWFYVRMINSPDPSWKGMVPLARSWVLRKPSKSRSSVWVEPFVNPESGSVDFRVREGGKPSGPTVVGAKGTCLATGSPIDDAYIKAEATAGRLIDQPVAVIASRGRSDKIYLALDGELPQPGRIERPQGITLSTHPQYMAPPRYGYATTTDLFNARQLNALMTCSDLLHELGEQVRVDAEHSGLPSDPTRLHNGGRGVAAYADAVVTYLAFVIDKCADYWSVLATWEGSFVRSTFPDKQLQMAWDYFEVNPFSGETGSLGAMIEWVAKAVEQLPAGAPADIQQMDAAARIAAEDGIVVSTDPPYYDSVPYADLSDFFYFWLRRNLRDIWPDITSTLATPKAEELVADVQRHGGRQGADSFFESGMQAVFGASLEKHRTDLPMTVYYAFKQEERGDDNATGWEAFLQGLLNSGFAITATWPLRTERPGRLRELGSSALASSIVITCRPRPVDAPMATRSELVATLRTELPAAIKLLQRQNIAPVDMAQSAIGPGMAIFSRFRRVVDADGSSLDVRSALAVINEVLQEVLSEEETEFDPDTRWALTWYEQFGLEAGGFGVAETLSKAKNTSVAGVVSAGLITERAGKVRLLHRNELDSSWDPTEDARLTVWEITHHLVQALDSSEVAAADLLRRVGSGLGEQARQLGYLLYSVAQRMGWAKEAADYNGLIVAWPEITRLAGRSTGQAEEPLFTEEG